jgi:hypothetical protein
MIFKNRITFSSVLIGNILINVSFLEGVVRQPTKEELLNLNFKRGDTFQEFLQNNLEFHKKRTLQTRGIEPTPENLDKVEEIVKKEQEKTSEILLQTRSFFDYSAEEFLCEAKYPLIAAGATLSIYSYLLLKLYNAKNYVNKTTTWACFNKNIPIESLYEIPQEKFLADLEVVIYRTFSEDEDKPNYQDTEPLYLFVKAAQKEIKRLEKFVNLYWYCKLPLISFLFPNYDDELILAQEKIERLSYMQELVTKKLCEMHS